MTQQLLENTSKDRLNGLLVLCIIIFCAALFRVPTLFEPWGGDQGTYGYIADGILKDKVPYKDMYTNTSYGLYFTYAIFFKLFGNHMMALHIGDFIASLLIIILTFYLTRLLYGKECAIYAAIMAAFFGNGQAFSCLVDMKGAWGSYWQLAQRETFMTLFFTTAVLIAIIADRRKIWFHYIWVGLLIGLAAVFKATALGIAFFLALHLFYAEILRKDGDGLSIFVLKSTCFGAGFVIIQLPFLYYFWINDSLHAMYNAVFVHTSIYAKLSRGNIVANFFMGNTYILFENLILWVFSFAAMIYLMIHERTRENSLITTWTVGTLFIIWAQGKFFGYHYILIVAPFSILTGFGIMKFLKVMPSWKGSLDAAAKSIMLTVLWVLIVCNMTAFLLSKYDYYKWSFKYFSGKISKDQYYEVFNEYPLHCYSFAANYKVANYLMKHAKPGASLRTLDGGGETVIHYLSGLESATKFTATWYLFNPYLYSFPITTKLRRQFIEELKTEKPDYILLVYFTMDEFRQHYKDEKYFDTIELMDYISKNYIFEKSFGNRRALYKKIS